ncbi:MAG TPA: hypothetical protein VFO29_09900 [Candidatus Rubrimentiphilum sp.]|nr:hypothetical protein [Candidatus Rubrimentiphilum sp.]
MLVDLVIIAQVRIVQRAVYITVAAEVWVKPAFMPSDVDAGVRDKERALDAAIVE